MEKQRYERPMIKKLESNMPDKFGMRTQQKPMTHIDGIAVRSLTGDSLIRYFRAKDQGERAKGKKGF
jgi:hypothetical protein